MKLYNIIFTLCTSIMFTSAVMADTNMTETEQTTVYNSEIKSETSAKIAYVDDIIFDECFKIPDDMFATQSMENHLKRLNKNLECDISVNVGGRVITLEKSKIAEMTDRNTGGINYNQIYSWCKYIYDCYGSSTTFKSWNGSIVSLPKGDYRVNETFTTRDIVSQVFPALLTFSDLSLEFSPSLGNSYIECDISNQKIFWFQNGKCVLSTDCVTGKKSTPTPTGTFSIKNILGRTRLRGSSWDTMVNHWSAFYMGCGLHDASWQSSFGLARWQAGYGSHGCINLPSHIADQMSQYMTVGEPIVVYSR